MDWISYVIYALLLWFLLSRFLPVKGLQNLAPREVEDLLKKGSNHVFIDVREAGEYRRGHIKGFINLPLSELSKRANEVPQNRVVVLTCHSGMRSRRAAKMLRKHGIRNLCHLKTGVAGWSGSLVKGAR